MKFALHARIFGSKVDAASTRSWSLPVWFLPSLSSSQSIITSAKHAIVLNAYIAKELAIENGDVICFEVKELGQEFSYPVQVIEHCVADFVVHGVSELDPPMIRRLQYKCPDMISIDTLVGFQINVKENLYQFPSTKRKRSGSINIFFDGQGCIDPKIAAGYSFYILSDDGNELIRGYGCKAGRHTNLVMEYFGFMNSIIWANRLSPETVSIRGGSEIILNQLKSETSSSDPKLRICREKARTMIESVRSSGSEVSFLRKGTVKSGMDKLKYLAVQRLENKIEVNWDNVDTMMKLRESDA